MIKAFGAAVTACTNDPTRVVPYCEPITPHPSDFLQFVVYPSIIVGITAGLAVAGYLFRTLMRRLAEQDKVLGTLTAGLGIVVAQVTPPGQPPLRDLVTTLGAEVQHVKERQAERLAREESSQPH